MQISRTTNAGEPTLLQIVLHGVLDLRKNQRSKTGVAAAMIAASYGRDSTRIVSPKAQVMEWLYCFLRQIRTSAPSASAQPIEGTDPPMYEFIQ